MHEVLRAPGNPLDATTRAHMEPRFGHDFSSVRVHSGKKAAASARAVDALAYAVGSHIVFDTGQYAPNTSAGRRLLLHELTHVVQQDKDAPNALPASLYVAPDTGPSEHQARRSEHGVIEDRRGLTTTPSLPPNVVQRQAANNGGGYSRTEPASDVQLAIEYTQLMTQHALAVLAAEREGRLPPPAPPPTFDAYKLSKGARTKFSGAGARASASRESAVGSFVSGAFDASAEAFEGIRGTPDVAADLLYTVALNVWAGAVAETNPGIEGAKEVAAAQEKAEHANATILNSVITGISETKETVVAAFEGHREAQGRLLPTVVGAALTLGRSLLRRRAARKVAKSVVDEPDIQEPPPSVIDPPKTPESPDAGGATGTTPKRVVEKPPTPTPAPKGKPVHSYYGGGDPRAGRKRVKRTPMPEVVVQEAKHPTGRPVVALSDAERAMVTDAKAASARLGKPLKVKTKAAATEGDVRRSGSGKRGSGPELTGRVMDEGRKIGHDFEENSFKDNGIPGQEKASHAEKLAAIENPGKALAVDRVMCADCFAFFQKLAKARGQYLTVHEPGQTWVFRPDGARVGIAPGSHVVIQADGSASASPGAVQ
ncbi:MAG TPA: DUF4157 domain-containing protein [Gemmatimonadaceae bacterium]|nr:DUF4157 domain-containing protein [Gemmatimonadaceae bacterium]